MNTIAWSTLKTAYKSAEEIPAALDQLQASDPQVRQDAWWKVSSVVNQGYLYDAAPFVALELLSRMLRGLVTDKEQAYDLLFEMGHNGFDSGSELVTLPDGRTERLPQACREIMELGLDL